MYKYIPDSYFQYIYDHNTTDAKKKMVNVYLNKIHEFLIEAGWVLVSSNYQFNPRDKTFDGAIFNSTNWNYYDGYVMKDPLSSHYLYFTAFDPTNTRIYSDIVSHPTKQTFIACFIFDEFDSSKYIYEQKNIQLVDCESGVGPYIEDYTRIHEMIDKDADKLRFRIFGCRGYMLYTFFADNHNPYAVGMFMSYCGGVLSILFYAGHRNKIEYEGKTSNRHSIARNAGWFFYGRFNQCLFFKKDEIWTYSLGAVNLIFSPTKRANAWVVGWDDTPFRVTGHMLNGAVSIFLGPEATNYLSYNYCWCSSQLTRFSIATIPSTTPLYGDSGIYAIYNSVPSSVAWNKILVEHGFAPSRYQSTGSYNMEPRTVRGMTSVKYPYSERFQGLVSSFYSMGEEASEPYNNYLRTVLPTFDNIITRQRDLFAWPCIPLQHFPTLLGNAMTDLIRYMPLMIYVERQPIMEQTYSWIGTVDTLVQVDVNNLRDGELIVRKSGEDNEIKYIAMKNHTTASMATGFATEIYARMSILKRIDTNGDIYLSSSWRAFDKLRIYASNDNGSFSYEWSVRYLENLLNNKEVDLFLGSHNGTNLYRYIVKHDGVVNTRLECVENNCTIVKILGIRE